MTTRSGVYSYSEVKPAGDADKNWACTSCNGDYVLAAVSGYRVWLSADRGVTWNETYPTGGAYDASWMACAVSTNGKMLITNASTAKTYMNLAGAWAEVKPAGASLVAKFVSVSPDGTRALIGGINGGSGRLWSYYDGTWTEERPAGDVDKEWRGGKITNNGDMIACVYNGRLYKKTSSTWSEIQPAGAANKSWADCAISSDGTKFLAAIRNGYLWHYDGSSWSRVDSYPYYFAGLARYHSFCSMDDTGEKIIWGMEAWGGCSNAAMCEIHSDHSWGGLAGSRNGVCQPFISSDGSLIVVGHKGGRLYVYDKDDLAGQVAGGYRKAFTCTRAAGTAGNHKVRIRVFNKYENDTYLHCEGRANDDFSDVYFKNAAGDTLRHCFVNNEINCNGLHTGYYRYVWVELDEVGASPLTFYMHYGDSSHTDSATAPASFFDKYDDFERGSDTDSVGGDWTITAGAVQVSTDAAWRGTRSMELVSSTGAKGAANIAATAGDETYIGFFIQKHGDTGMVAQHGNGSAYAQWSWGQDETLKNYTGGAYGVSLLSPAISEWQWIEMLGFNWAGSTYDLYTGNAVRGDDLSMQASVGHTDVFQLSTLGAAAGRPVFIDSLVVCTNCNPYASPDSESIGAEELAGEGGGATGGPAGVKTWNDVPSANIKTWNDIPWNTIKTMN